MGRYTGKSCRFVAMISLTILFFLVELITGYITKSLALVSDSFHMLSDIIALIIGFLALRISKKSSPDGGWKRAEVLGALINSVLLIALCFTIFVDAIQRLIVIETITNPILVLVVGCAGLAVNGIGLCLFGTHGLPHGHVHGAGIDSATSKHTEWKRLHSAANTANAEAGETEVLNEQPVCEDAVHDTDSKQINGVTSDEQKDLSIETPKKPHGNLNMRGVFLHVLGDALGSVVVIISALFIWLTNFPWRHYVDPVMSLVIVAIITVTTIPLFRQSSRILLESLPSDMNLARIKEKLKESTTDPRSVSTVQVLFGDETSYTLLAEDIRDHLVDIGIDVTTALRECVNTGQ